MRRLFVALSLLGLAPQAVAGEFDMPTLRGTSPFIPAPAQYARWSGAYIGGQLGQNSTSMNFAGATADLISYLLRTTALENQQRPSEWGVLGSSHPTGKSYGGFIGFNTQWQDAVIGVDLHYSRSDFFGTAPVSPISRVVSAGGNTYLVDITGDASMRITDFGAARVRAGWAAGNFLPYVTGGVAVGRADVTRSAHVSGVENFPAGYPAVPCNPLAGCTEFSFSSSESKNSAFIYGWSGGFGLDVMVMPNVFLRGEYEHIQFSKAFGINARIQTGRVGAGIKF